MIKAWVIVAAALMSHGAVAAQIVQTTVKAQRAHDFLYSLGVNLHLNSEWDTAYSDVSNGGVGAVGSDAATGAVRVGATTTNVSKIVQGLRYLGLQHARVGATYGYVRDRILAVAQGVPGLRIDDLFSAEPGASIGQQMALAKTLGSVVETFEGLNEAAVSAKYKGLAGAAADCLFQSDLFAAAAAYNAANHSHVGVLAPTVSGSNLIDYQRLAACADKTTASNGHFYSAYLPPTQQLMYNIPYTGLDSTSGAPVAATETGYPTNPLALRGVTEDVAAKWTLATTLGFFMHNVRHTYFYEEADEFPQTPRLNDPSNPDEMEQHFGLFHNDWTPKRSAQMLHAQARIMADYAPDAATFTPAGLTFGVTGLPATGYSLLLQKGTGMFVLVLWNEPAALWHPATSTAAGWAATVAGARVAVTFARPMTAARVYDPFDATRIDASGWATPQQAIGHAGSVSVTLTDHPVYLLLQP